MLILDLAKIMSDQGFDFLYVSQGCQIKKSSKRLIDVNLGGLLFDMFNLPNDSLSLIDNFLVYNIMPHRYNDSVMWSTYAKQNN